MGDAYCKMVNKSYTVTNGAYSNTISTSNSNIVYGSIEADYSVKFGGRYTNKIESDLSRFTLIERFKFLYNLLFKGKAIMEVNPKLIKFEKALDILRNSK